MSAALRRVPAVILTLETLVALVLVATVELHARIFFEPFGTALPYPAQLVVDFGVHFFALLLSGGVTADAIVLKVRRNDGRWGWLLILMPAPLITWAYWAITIPYSTKSSFFLRLESMFLSLVY